MRTLDQERARRAYAAVDALDPESQAFARARALPMLLLQNGLLATWAFLLSKKDEQLLETFLEHFRASADLAAVVGSGSVGVAFRRWMRPDAQGLDGVQLRALSAEALELAGWIKRAVEARSPQTKGGDGNRG